VRRTLVGFVLVALAVGPAWVALADGPFPFGDVLALVALALLPTLAVELRVPGRTRRNALVTGLTALGATLVASAVAFGTTLGDARPGDPTRDFFGPVLGEFRQGFLDFYDAKVPFDPVEYPGMRGAVLVATFAFVALAGMAIAARRPFLALSALVVGAGWPATMVSTWVESSRPLLTGAFILLVALALVLLLRPQTRSLSHAAVAATVLVVLAVGGSMSDAVAKPGFVDWDSWDFYDRPDDPVDVRYVWDADYDGIAFPEEKTTVLKVRMPGPKRSLYWRATTLDRYTGFVWREELERAREYEGEERIDVTPEADPLLPAVALDREEWVEQEVEIRALDEQRLVGSGQIVRWEPRTSGPAQLATNGSLVVPGALRRGQRYKVWSYVPQPKPGQLNRTGTAYPDAAHDFLAVAPGVELPEFGAPLRDEFMDGLFRHEAFVAEHEPLYRAALRVTRRAQTPYEAVVALESWFRGRERAFVYDEQPPVGNGVDPPLVEFLRTKRGYCQHFAGAMATMLRYLGVPARVAAGFTSGTYDPARREWTVNDHNAHTWVEVYFPRVGWVPFDPTPDRGELAAVYTPFGGAFDVRDAAGLNSAALEGIPEIRERLESAGRLEEGSGAIAAEGGEAGGPSAVGRIVRSVLGLVLVVGGLAAGIILLAKAVRRRLRFATRDPRLLAAAVRRDLVGYVVDQGYAVPPSATVRELGRLIQRSFGVDTGAFVAALTDARYGPPAGSRERARRAQKELRRLRRGMSRGLGLGDRIRGALSLRSLTP
jgi:protein-glutamine gamma-glutamyltransferase